MPIIFSLTGSQTKLIALRQSLYAACVALLITSAPASLAITETSGGSWTWRFNAAINDKKVGYHEYRVTKVASGYRAESEASFRYKVFGVTVFKYQHQALEHYDEDFCLTGIATETQAAGRDWSIAGALTPQGFAVTEYPGEDLPKQTEQQCVAAFAYWAPNLRERSELLNGQTGDAVNVNFSITASHIATRNPQFVEMRGEQIAIVLEYGEDGTWRGLRSNLREGRTLQYTLASFSEAGPATGREPTPKN